MCAIVDTSVANEVFSINPPEAGLKFAQWVSTGKGKLVVTGKLLDELNKTLAGNWIQQAFMAGSIKNVGESDVEARTKKLQTMRVCKSDDPHVIALAQVSGARLLYSNDRKLQDDFKDKNLIDQPRGKVYSTDEGKNPKKEFRPVHRRLLGKKDLCRAKS